MSTQDDSEVQYFQPGPMFKPPDDLPAPDAGKITVCVMFVIPGLNLAKNDAAQFESLANALGHDLCLASFRKTQNDRTKESATLVSLGLSYEDVEDEGLLQAQLESICHSLCERFVGALTFSAGIYFRAICRQFAVRRVGNQYRHTLPTVAKSPNRLEFKLLPRFWAPDDIHSDVYIALYWLRKGLAERDPVDKYAGLMVCLQV